MALPNWGGVGEVEGGEVVDGALEVEEGGEDVGAFVDAGMAGELAAEDAAGGAVEDEFDAEGLGTGVVGGVVVAGDVGGVDVEAGGAGGGFAQAGDADGEGEDLDDGGCRRPRGKGIGDRGEGEREEAAACSPARRPCLLAGPARGMRAGFPVTPWRVSAASPTA